VNINIPDGPTIPPVPTSYPAVTSNITVSGIPAAAIITNVRARFNITHVWVSDLVIALKAPNGNVYNLDALLNRTNNPGANFVNTVIGATGNTLNTGTAPYTGTFRADGAGATFTALGFTWPGGPVGFIPNTATHSGLYSVPNGVWSVGIYDAGAPDGGTLNDWSIDIDYVLGVPATPAVWSPAAGLFSDAAASVPYVAGTAVDSVWTRPTPSGVYPYQVTVQSLPAPPLSFTNPAPVAIPIGGVGTPYPSNLTVSGLPTTGVTVASVVLNNLSHTWSEDVDILLQSPTGTNVILMSDVGGATAISGATFTFADSGPAMSNTAANPSGTYRPSNNGATDNFPAPGPGNVTQANPAISMFTGDMNGVWRLFALDDDGIGDQGNLAGGYTINFALGVTPCTSPARTVVVTVNQPTTLNPNLPVNQTICTDKVATFTVAVTAGTGPHSYQWQVSTNNGNTYANIANNSVYSGVTTATLTITTPPVSMSGYFYRCIVTGAAPCAAITSFAARLVVNPLPVVVISANPYTSLFPGLSTTISSTVSPNAAATYTWLRNGVPVAGASTGTVNVDVDGLGDYQLRVLDVNGCTNISNLLTIKDSASAKCFIYPNPNSGQFQVRYYSAANNVLPRTLTVYDAKGDRVLTQLYTVGRPYDRMDVDMRAYGKGMYWVEIGDRNGNRLTMCRVIIQ
jgi:subtilisin-like proprotein convertase family protein